MEHIESLTKMPINLNVIIRLPLHQINLASCQIDADRAVEGEEAVGRRGVS